MASLKVEQAKAATASNMAVWEKTAIDYDEYTISSGLVKPLSNNTLTAVRQGLQREGSVLLDVASASGEPAFTVAQALPSCRVICTDLSSTLVALAAKKAAAQGLVNVTCLEADAQDLSAFGDASMDAVTCQHGLMFVPDVDLALQEFARVLKPGGLLAVSVWCNQMTIQEVAGETMAALPSTKPSPPPPAANPKRFADPAPLLASMRAAGLTDIQQAQHSVEMRYTPDAFVQFFFHIGPLGAYIRGLTGDDKAAKVAEAESIIKQKVAEKGQMQEDGTILLGNNLYFTISARKPAK